MTQPRLAYAQTVLPIHRLLTSTWTEYGPSASATANLYSRRMNVIRRLQNVQARLRAHLRWSRRIGAYR